MREHKKNRRGARQYRLAHLASGRVLHDGPGGVSVVRPRVHDPTSSGRLQVVMPIYILRFTARASGDSLILVEGDRGILPSPRNLWRTMSIHMEADIKDVLGP